MLLPREEPILFHYLTSNKTCQHKSLELFTWEAKLNVWRDVLAVQMWRLIFWLVSLLFSHFFSRFIPFFAPLQHVVKWFHSKIPKRVKIWFKIIKRNSIYQKYFHFMWKLFHFFHNLFFIFSSKHPNKLQEIYYRSVTTLLWH